MRTTDHRANRLFIILAGIFLTTALIAEFVGVKIFALEPTVGADPFHWSMFGIDGTLNFTAGVLLWPFVFIMTDVINEYFGVRGVRLISWIAVVFIGYAFIAAYAAISLAAAQFWIDVVAGRGVSDSVVVRRVESIDVAPTIAALLGIEAPALSSGRVLSETLR